MKPRAMSKLPRFKLKKVDSFATNNCENSVLQKEFAHLPPRSSSDLPDQHSCRAEMIYLNTGFWFKVRLQDKMCRPSLDVTSCDGLIVTFVVSHSK
ncbi:hypothetical protein CEXT_320881 [Caerostris extrusa]|uniref:Uncharacterized protein n=1 Tax=Caerostris extrusa TaxID=172846 RepID=A0AAV4V7E0_CAEEX|nr:hypothetical protein CEXT_320881 [Caerostris extrusa]